MTISAWNEIFKIRSKILLTKVKMDNQIENSIKNERFCIKIFAILFDYFHNNLQYDLHHTNNVTSFLGSIICAQKWKFLCYGKFRTFFSQKRPFTGAKLPFINRNKYFSKMAIFDKSVNFRRKFSKIWVPLWLPFDLERK